MKFINPFLELSKFELILWLISILVITFSYILSPNKDILTIIASLIGVTALIFVSKGYVFGQFLTVIFAIFYGIISFYFRYYGEMITYLFMTAPIAVMSMISWYKNPYKNTKVVQVNKIIKKHWIILLFLSLIVTIIFYYILSFLGNSNIVFSTLSITTSFLASSLTFLRSPYYAIAYSANDIVLIILWILATIENTSYFPMIICFVMFLLNDLYGYYNWKKLMISQEDI